MVGGIFQSTCFVSLLCCGLRTLGVPRHSNYDEFEAFEGRSAIQTNCLWYRRILLGRDLALLRQTYILSTQNHSLSKVAPGKRSFSSVSLLMVFGSDSLSYQPSQTFNSRPPEGVAASPFVPWGWRILGRLGGGFLLTLGVRILLEDRQDGVPHIVHRAISSSEHPL